MTCHLIYFLMENYGKEIPLATLVFSLLIMPPLSLNALFYSSPLGLGGTTFKNQ